MQAIDYGVYIVTEDGQRHAMPAIPVDEMTQASIDALFKSMVEMAGTDLKARLDVLSRQSAFSVSVVLQMTLFLLAKQLEEEGITFNFGLNS